MKKPSSLHDLLMTELKDLYHSEQQLLKSLPRMMRQAQSEKLAQTMKKWNSTIELHINRMEDIFEAMDMPARGKKCDAMMGLLSENKELMEEYADSPISDAALISSVRKISHYEMASYSTAHALAEALDMHQVASLLHETHMEEKQMDQAFLEIAKNEVLMESMASR